MELRRLCLALSAMVVVVNAGDQNPVFNPCAPTVPVGGKDSISIAVGFAGEPSVWYNSANQLAPCEHEVVQKMSANARVSVFRPLLDQISMLRTNNASYLDLTRAFPGNATVIAYAGNPTIVSEPRYFLVPYGRIPAYTLVIELSKGKLVNLRWKNDKCEPCGKNTDACFQGTCATPETSCLDPDSSLATATGADACRFSINVAFSGTDKNNVLMNSWYQVKSIEQYSITSLFTRAGNMINQVGLSIIDDNLGG